MKRSKNTKTRKLKLTKFVDDSGDAVTIPPHAVFLLKLVALMARRRKNLWIEIKRGSWRDGPRSLSLDIRKPKEEI